MVFRNGGRDLVRPYGPGARQMPDKKLSLLMENAQLLFMNFAGRPGQYNAEGDRNFCVLIDADIADDMRADGWNVKQLKGYEGEEGDHYIQIAVKYRDRNGKDLIPPKIILQSSKGREGIGENLVDLLDVAEFSKVDLIINGRARVEDGETKVKGYLKTMYAHLYEDYLDKKYAEVPEVEGSAGLPELEMSQAAQDARDGIVEGHVVEDEE